MTAWAIRNPMIGAVLLILFGESILFSSVVLFLWSVFFLVGNILYFHFSEEPALVKRFGVSYIEYKNSVPMIIPCIYRYLRKK